MFRGASGFTIIELTIGLAISLILLASVALTLNGTNGKTQFAESMRNVNSKLLAWIGDVNHGFPGGDNRGYHCVVVGVSPQINTGASPTENPDCIYLGKVIQFTVASDSCPSCVPNVTDQSSKLYAYSVFGRRTMNAAGDLTDSLTNANPVPAVGPQNAVANAGSKDLTETYTMGGGTTVKSITSSTSAPLAPTRLLGITQSFNASAGSANGAQDLFVYANLANSSPPGNINGGSAVTNCIELITAGNCQTPPALNSFAVCFASGYNSQTALITITSGSVLGVQTKLEFKPC